MPWVACFGISGKLVPKAAQRVQPFLPALGCTTLVVVFVALSALAWHRQAGLTMMSILAVGGAGLGTSFTGVLTHLTANAPGRTAADLSGLFTTTLQVCGALGVAIFGGLYSAQATAPLALFVSALGSAAVLVLATICVSTAMRPRQDVPIW